MTKDQIIAQEVSKEIKDNFDIVKNTFVRTVKDNPADRISIEIGDSKQPDFKPQYKISRGHHVPHTEEAKQKMRLAKLGKKLSEEHKQKISDALKGKMPKNIHMLDNSGANSHWWKGGITPEHERLRKTKEYRLWRTAVFMRDNYTCQNCGDRSKKSHRVTIHADHIKPFSRFPELRFAIDNGRTLCVECHKKTDTYGRTIHASN